MRPTALLKVLLLLSLCAGFAMPVVAQEKLRMVSRGDGNADYSIGLIKLALSKAPTRYEITIDEGALTAKRLQQELSDGTLDITWAATSAEQEALAIPIRIPLYKGLMGYRVLLIHRDNQNLFSSVRTIDDLRKFQMGQGRGWPDTTIMQANGLEVVQATKYESLFYMVDGKRFDAFPRGIHEPWAEMTKRPTLELSVDNHVLLVYRMPFYLFVTPNKPKLAEDIERGLLAAIEDGSFDEYFYNNPTVKMVLEKVDFSNLKVFELTNPTLPEETPLDNPKLWVSIDELKAKALTRPSSSH
jgi:hypothetical protein